MRHEMHTVSLMLQKILHRAIYAAYASLNLSLLHYITLQQRLYICIGANSVGCNFYIKERVYNEIRHVKYCRDFVTSADDGV